ncbi:MAG: hypothetical protein J3K34DRAFT_435699 [Monoraphidium minutum]|nr:MAG: hypothetical protein J3K34DRAFT_435699 [Monoraphidium minutum]
MGTRQLATCWAARGRARAAPRPGLRSRALPRPRSRQDLRRFCNPPPEPRLRICRRRPLCARIRTQSGGGVGPGPERPGGARSAGQPGDGRLGCRRRRPPGAGAPPGPCPAQFVAPSPLPACSHCVVQRAFARHRYPDPRAPPKHGPAPPHVAHAPSPARAQLWGPRPLHPRTRARAPTHTETHDTRRHALPCLDRVPPPCHTRTRP